MKRTAECCRHWGASLCYRPHIISYAVPARGSAVPAPGCLCLGCALHMANVLEDEWDSSTEHKERYGSCFLLKLCMQPTLCEACRTGATAVTPTCRSSYSGNQQCLSPSTSLGHTTHPWLIHSMHFVPCICSGLFFASARCRASYSDQCVTPLCGHGTEVAATHKCSTAPHPTAHILKTLSRG